VSTTSILLKAKLFVEENKIENFKAYPSWALRFMRRNNLCICSTSSVGLKLPDDLDAKVEKFRLYVKENLCGVDKKEHKTDCNNYRGILLLPTTYKILSNILLSR
jgi:hypothetical protein